MDELKELIEALVFVSDEPLSRNRMLSFFADRDGLEIEEALEALRREYDRSGRGLVLREVGGGFQLTTRPEFDEIIRSYLRARRRAHLSPQALEALAIVAYEQPITTPEIAELRGTDSSGVLRTLLERKLVRIVGRKDVVGRPFLWATTKRFLVHFGLSSLDDLPKPEEFVTLIEETRAAGVDVSREDEGEADG